ncbi:MAG TPA: polyphosphate kinase 2 family protein [Candidatus Dormibacteraeota bacterium]|nr:polyphosphate kinase 2 family protein [Candidatus Dormibacteraeota bacterium]
MPDLDHARIEALASRFRVRPGRTVRLPEDFDPGDTAGVAHVDADDLLDRSVELLSEYQARLAAQDTYGLLVILQALDAAGKDGTIKHVMHGVDPQGVTVHSFKAPSVEELQHDYLWRASKALPLRGQIGIFNRSYYEEALIVRVHRELLDTEKLPPAAERDGVWRRRFREISDWERYLVDNGFRIVKLFLNVSKDEQRRRFLARIDEPDKNWKFNAADVHERASWDAYQAAYSDVLTHTSTDAAPWHVIPADHKWFARLASAAVILQALIEIDPRFPTAGAAERAALLQAKAELEAEARSGEGRKG